MNKIFYFILLTMLAAAAVRAQTSQFFKTDDGLQIEVSVRMEKETIMLAETTFIVFEIKNLSDKDFYNGLSLHGDLTGRPRDFNVVVTGPNNKIVPQVKEGGFHGFGGIKKISPNESYVTKLVLPSWVKFEKIGTYQITVEKRVSIHNRETDGWQYFNALLATKLDIVPTDQKKLGEVIDFLAETMLDEKKLWGNFVRDDVLNMDDSAFHSGQALMLLGFIDDRRTIRYLVALLDKYSREKREKSFGMDETRLCERAIWLLAKRAEPEALEAIKKAMTSPDEKIRETVARVLIFRQKPEELNLLLTMRDDEYWPVRLKVVEALASVPTVEATEMLRDFLKDKEESVREEARKYLNERGHNKK